MSFDFSKIPTAEDVRNKLMLKSFDLKKKNGEGDAAFLAYKMLYGEVAGAIDEGMAAYYATLHDSDILKTCKDLPVARQGDSKDSSFHYMYQEVFRRAGVYAPDTKYGDNRYNNFDLAVMAIWYKQSDREREREKREGPGHWRISRAEYEKRGKATHPDVEKDETYLSYQEAARRTEEALRAYVPHLSTFQTKRFGKGSEKWISSEKVAEAASTEYKRATAQRDSWLAAKQEQATIGKAIPNFSDHHYWVLAAIREGKIPPKEAIEGYPDLLLLLDPPSQIHLRRPVDLRSVPVEDLLADYKARGMDAKRAYSQLVIDRALNPGVDMSYVASEYPHIQARLLVGSGAAVSFDPTHRSTVTGMPVEVTELPGKCKWIEWSPTGRTYTGTSPGTPEQIFGSVAEVIPFRRKKYD